MSQKGKRGARAPKTDTSHYFIDGYSPRRGLISLVAYPNRLRGLDVEFTTLYFIADNDWSHETFEFDGRSVTYMGPAFTGEWWLLGKRGEVARLGDDITFEQIPGAGTGPGSYGYLNRITNIENKLYVCGYRRQVLVRQDESWQRHDAGLIEPIDSDGSSLESLDGLRHDCIYAVGSMGQIWYFDGSHWEQQPSPTNADLHEVRVISESEVLIVGQRGTVLIGARRNWRLLANPDLDEDLWGVEKFGGQVYISGYSGLGKVDGDQIVPIDTGLGRVVLGYRLRAKDDLLWSIGNDDILVFDGSKWLELHCPDNAP